MGRDDFTKIPNGIPSLEDRVNLYFTHGVKARPDRSAQFVDAASTQAAKLFGLFPRKGTIQPGSDADLVVYDPDYRGKISAQDAADEPRLQRVRRLGNRRPPDLVTVRGEVAARDGKFVGDIGHGKFLAREPNHF